jgi:pimeloyl-ACP methyl ester carboxylesterase
MSILLGLALAVALFLASVTLILLIIGPVMLLQPRRRTADFYRSLGLPLNPADIGLPYEEINIIPDEGIKLNSWLIKAGRRARGTIIYLHGVADCKIDGLRLAKLLHDHRFNVFLYDARRHGNSGGKYCTYGFYEKGDLLKVIDYLESRTDIPPGKIGLFGTSMGAAVALQSAAIDRRIAAVAAENSFATLRSIFDDYQRRMIKLPFHFLRNIVIVRSEFIARFHATEVSPLDAVGQISVPILFITGTEDHLINPQYSKSLYDHATGPKELFEVEQGSHSNIWEVAGKKYETTLLNFYEQALV